jgi:branched-chain amino acid transport system ATP-binding protein
MLKIENLSVHYGQALALEKINITVPEKGLTAIIGPNGAGKSTLLKAISRIVDPSNGRIFFKGKSLSEYGPSEVARMGIAYCPEGRRPFREMSVMDNLLVGGYTLSKSELQNQLHLILELFPILSERRRQDAGTLSGGEQQILAIARALMSRPSLLLIDEPSLGLSPVNVEVVEKTIDDIKGRGMSVLMVEGNIDVVRYIADSVYVFDHGASVFFGTVSDIMKDNNLSRSYFGI